MITRPLTDESGYTCDWGDCNEVAVVERDSPEHGWLPVCPVHGPLELIFADLDEALFGGKWKSTDDPWEYLMSLHDRLRRAFHPADAIPPEGQP